MLVLPSAITTSRESQPWREFNVAADEMHRNLEKATGSRNLTYALTIPAGYSGEMQVVGALTTLYGVSCPATPAMYRSSGRSLTGLIGCGAVRDHVFQAEHHGALISSPDRRQRRVMRHPVLLKEPRVPVCARLCRPHAVDATRILK